MRVKGPAILSKPSIFDMYGGATTDATKKSAEPETPKVPRVKEGFMKLLKQSGMKSTWMKRYITLTNSTLEYYRAQDVCFNFFKFLWSFYICMLIYFILGTKTAKNYRYYKRLFC